MNTMPRLCAAALLAICMQMSVAQNPPPEAPPPEPSRSEEPDAEQTRSGRFGQKFDESVDAIRTHSVERRDEALASARRGAENLDRQLARLQQQQDQGWSRMSQSARTRVQATREDLRTRRNALAEWYGGMRHSSTAAWEEARGGFVNSYHELADAMKRAKAEFEQDEKGDVADESKPEDKP